MSCRWCEHWKNEENKYEIDENENFTRRLGECRRYPEPLKKWSDYICGEFRIKPDDVWYIDLYYEHMLNYKRKAGQEKTKRMALENTNKELRRKLKATKTP